MTQPVKRPVTPTLRRRKSITLRKARFSGLLTADEWEGVVRALKLSPGQARVVRLILRGYQDKQIGTALHLKRSTVRTYLDRIFTRLDVADRVELVLRVFAALKEIPPRNGCPPEV